LLGRPRAQRSGAAADAETLLSGGTRYEQVRLLTDLLTRPVDGCGRLAAMGRPPRSAPGMARGPVDPGRRRISNFGADRTAVASTESHGPAVVPIVARNDGYHWGNPGVVRTTVLAKPLVESVCDAERPPRNEKVVGSVPTGAACCCSTSRAAGRRPATGMCQERGHGEFGGVALGSVICRRGPRRR
jgi:hypothetical protein